jgi:hypothetical protein
VKCFALGLGLIEGCSPARFEINRAEDHGIGALGIPFIQDFVDLALGLVGDPVIHVAEARVPEHFGSIFVLEKTGVICGDGGRIQQHQRIGDQ